MAPSNTGNVRGTPSANPSSKIRDTPLTACVQHGTICWLEIPVLSATRAASFYTAVLGWECTPSHSSSSTAMSTSPSAAAVHMFRGGCNSPASALQGAFIQVPEGCLIRAWEAHSPEMAVLTTFAVGSVEETLRRVAVMGGRVHSCVFSGAG